MGPCVSSSVHLTSLMDDREKARVVRYSPTKPVPRNFVFGQEHPPQQPKVLIKEIGDPSEQAKVFSQYWMTSSTTKPKEPIFIDRIGPADERDSISESVSATNSKGVSATNSEGVSASCTETTCNNSSSLLTDSFSIGDLVSFDGLNKRSDNRGDIGIQMLKAQIHFGANPQALSTHGDRTCLMFAVLANDIRFTKKLVKLGVDVNQTNRFGETALSLAVESRHHQLANYLRSKGAADVVISLK